MNLEDAITKPPVSSAVVSEFAEAICPLCSQVYPREGLQTHIAAEHARVREKTIQLIQAYCKGWLSEHGACEACWKSFRDASCTLSVIKLTKPQHRWNSV